jgi:ABC-type phosphate/phosphonate transport system substrate-binding protein
MPALASLPMYDLPEVRPALAALWAGIADHLRRDGVVDVPARLDQEQPAGTIWSSGELLLSQCCGADLTGAWAGRLIALATPCYDAPGCSGAGYASFVVVREDAPFVALEDLRGRIAAINHPDSHSGCNALRAVVAPLARAGRFFERIEISGSHLASLAMVARRAADVAAIDCVTHALLARHRPAALAGTRVLGRSPAAPAAPFVTRASASTELTAALRAALRQAATAPSLATARATLLLDGIAILPPAAYRRIPAFARLAARRGYPALA